MALNYSHRPVFSTHISEDNLVSPLRIANGYCVEGLPAKNGEGYPRPWHGGRGETEEWHFNCRRDTVHRCCSPESNSKDIVDLLPSDPFGMDIETTVTAFTGWLEDLEVEYGGYMRSNNGMMSPENYGLFAEWNLFWNNAFKFQPIPGDFQFNEKLNIGIQSFPSNTRVYEKPCVDISSFPSSVQLDQKLDLDVTSKVNQYEVERDFGGALASCMGFRDESTSCSSKLQFREKVEGSSKVEGVPHEALVFALSYLGVKDLLSVERVCKSLCSTVRGDPLMWMSIHVDQPLNERITDDILLKLVSRAQGNLQCLSLVECQKVTDDGVRRVLEANPRLSKLFVPGCTKLSIEGMLNNIRIHNSNKDVPGIKHLRIGGLYGVTQEQFEEFKQLLGDDTYKLESHHKPYFFHRGNFYLPNDDDRVIDIEMCPRCDKFRLVYDCPAEDCLVKDKAHQACRACTLCIARCAQCGRCIDNNEYEETFCLDLLCADCFKQLHKYQDRLDKKSTRV